MTLERLGYNKLPDDIIRHVVGPPLTVSFHSIAKLPESRITEAVEVYRSMYLPRFLEPGLYPGIVELINDLVSAGVPLATATSKMERAAKRQIEHWDLKSSFTVIAGASPDPASTKTAVVADALKRLQQKGIDTSNAVLVGDRVFDAEGAEANGIQAIAAGWGYGDESEFGSPAVVAQAATVEDLRKILLG